MFKSNCQIGNLAKVASLRKVQVLLLAIMLLAFALRMFHASTTRMWGDEGFSVYSANRDLYAITFEGKDVDPHPPLYYYLFHFYLPLAGYSELAIRFFSVFFGTATVALIFAIGRKMFDARVGVVAAAIAAIAPFGVQYSQEVRMYALVMFLGAVALWFFLQIADSEWQMANRIAISHQPSAILWLGFFISMLLTQYSLYQSAFIFIAQGIFLLPFLKRRFSFFLRWLAVSGGIVILFLPWLFTHSGSAFADVKDVAGNTVPMNLLAFLARGFAAISVGPTIPLNNAMTLAALFAALIGVGLVFALATRAASQNDWLLVAFVVVPMVSLYPIYFLAPLYRGRLFAVAFVPLVLLFARGAGLIVSRVRIAAIPIALLVLGASAYSLNSYYFQYNRYSAPVEDYIPAIQMIEQSAQPGDVVLFHAYWQQGYFLSHYHGAPLTYGSIEKQSDLDAAVSKPRNVWAIVQALPYHGAEAWLAQHAFPLGEQKFGQMRVLTYRAGTPARGETFTAPIVFSNGIALLGAHVNDAPVESGRGIVTLQLDWQAAQKIPDDYAVSVR
ncbi:MAG: glycosyltransferase family 39 protein, partial [Chloroflexota bacterium]|nr:glycosyltransferase family 39 protein [Chloroflexota bacterium]